VEIGAKRPEEIMNPVVDEKTGGGAQKNNLPLSKQTNLLF
jgi:hypothetical protein